MNEKHHNYSKTISITHEFLETCHIDTIHFMKNNRCLVYHPLLSKYSYSEVKQYIDGLPETDSQELCGMNQNAEKAYLVNQTKTLLDDILQMQPRLTSRIIGYV